MMSRLCGAICRLSLMRYGASLVWMWGEEGGCRGGEQLQKVSRARIKRGGQGSVDYQGSDAFLSCREGELTIERTGRDDMAALHCGQRGSVRTSSTNTVSSVAQAVRHGPCPSSYWRASALWKTGTVKPALVRRPEASMSETPAPIVP